MSGLLGGVDPEDVAHIMAGAAPFGMTSRSSLQRFRFLDLPALPSALDPTSGGVATVVTERIAGAIVPLAGAGPSIDTREGWRSWQPTPRLPGICMPLRILAGVALGCWVAGRSLTAAVLLGGCLATSSVETGPPGEGGRASGPGRAHGGVGSERRAGLPVRLARRLGPRRPLPVRRGFVAGLGRS